ncbi:response regulator [Thauera linaloolentis]|uniref:LuxR family transcriptional regulator n=1 Tax=Thauera linaloolentis (strain DSM 12138 / JCM 21573 / CCUG 41526 / CIP 105981 / IAM 15112 / NBRC 102519 / 47Lol) TaxID=1123367 RepID=N6YUL7_THAL4|nr:response regulator transcription factor [Thauera linaloolentis]ENO85833.1 LuxR family transcriptional regulator [Thauera linaloolentis 47Lol = DSM 12138]MCM8567406.1 response regulator transcription factor [Thauera linaloolentis]
MNLNIVLADDHQMFRHALRALLEKEDGLTVVGEAADGEALLRLVDERQVDIVCIDIGMPGMNGIEATRRLLAQHPAIRVIGLSAYSDRQFVIDLLNAGAHGYVTKAAAGEDLLRAIHNVRHGRTYLCPEVAGAVASALRFGTELRTGSTPLTARERQVLQLISEGHTSARIAERLHVAASTIEVHRRNIMRKLDLHSVADLTRYAIRNGISQATE